MRIERLHLSNTGIFSSLDLEFQACRPAGKAEVHIFTGANGTGKSTLLYALAAALTGPFEQSEHLIFQRFRHDNAFLEVLFEGGQVINCYRQMDGFTPPETSYFLSKLPLRRESNKNGYLSGGHISHAYANLNPKALDEAANESAIRSFLKDKADIQGISFAAFAYSGNRSLNSLDELMPEELSLNNPLDSSLSFTDTTDSRQITQFIAAQKVKQALELADGNEEEAEKYNAVIQKIEEIIREIVGWDIKFKLKAKPYHLFLEVDRKLLQFDVLPDGLKSILSFIVDLMMRMDKIIWTDDRSVLERNFILFLDEIDIHLHPAWQRKILPVIQQTFPNAQIFVSTHSPFVVGSVSDAYVYSLTLENGSACLDKTEKSKAGSSYPFIAEKIFGIKESFDDETEKEFREFYRLRDDIMHGDDEKIMECLECARRLMEKGLEVKDIIGMEIRQMSRVLDKEFSI